MKTGIINNDIYDEIIIKYMNIINSKKNLQNKITDMKQLIYLSRSLIDINTFYRRFLSYLLQYFIASSSAWLVILEEVLPFTLHEPDLTMIFFFRS